MTEPTVGGSFFETEHHRAAAVRAIRGSILPLKFAYSGSGARRHIAFVGSTKSECHFISADEVRSGICREIVEIGPGNGARTAALLSLLSELKQPCQRLLAVDFSATLLAAAQHRIAKSTDPPTISTAVWDVEQGPSERIRQWRGPGPLLACFLGNTLGNVESETDTLANIHAALNPDDLLLVGVMLRRPNADILAPYRTESFNAAVLEPLRTAGIGPDDIDFDLYWNGLQVRGVATFRQPKQIDTMEVPPGHRLRCFQSRRYTCAGIVSLVEGAGFLVQRLNVDPTEDHMIVTALRGRGGVE